MKTLAEIFLKISYDEGAFYFNPFFIYFFIDICFEYDLIKIKGIV